MDRKASCLLYTSIPVTVLTAIVCAINFREIFSMLNKLVGKFLHHKKV